MDSILITIKKLIGIDETYDAFDTDMIVAINNAFSVLTQLGVGPEEGYSITDDTALWSDYISDSSTLQLVKQYIALKVKLIFDPPATSSVIKVYEEAIRELEWRLNVFVDPNSQTADEH